MRHLKKKNKLFIKYKLLMLANLSNSLIKYEFLKSTLVKSKNLKIFLEPLVNLAKFFCTYNIKFVFNKIRNIDSVFKLFKIIAPRYLYRCGGYLQILKLGFRRGDNAKLVIIKFI